MASRLPDAPEKRSRRLWIEGGVILAFWAVIMLLGLAKTVLDMRQGGGPPRPGMAAGLLAEYALWALLTPAIFASASLFRLEGPGWPARLMGHVFLAFGVAILVDVVDHAFIEPLLGVWMPPWFVDRYQPLSLLRVLGGLWFLDELIICLVVLAAGFARDYFRRYQERLRESAQLRAEAAELHAHLAEARLMALRMQLDPHFLFNTLHAVSALVERDPCGVRRMIARLSELLRYTLENQGTQEVTLRQDLRFLEGYLEIQRIRFQGKLEVTNDIAPEALDALVPNLVLQPLVENAVKHGVSRVEGAGRILVRAYRDSERLHLVVSDNGPGLAFPDGDGAGWTEGVGLRNTRERLEGLYGRAQSLELEPEPDGGLSAHISLPYHTAADLHALAVPAHR